MSTDSQSEQREGGWRAGVRAELAGQGRQERKAKLEHGGALHEGAGQRQQLRLTHPLAPLINSPMHRHPRFRLGCQTPQTLNHYQNAQAQQNNAAVFDAHCYTNSSFVAVDVFFFVVVFFDEWQFLALAVFGICTF